VLIWDGCKLVATSLFVRTENTRTQTGEAEGLPEKETPSGRTEGAEQGRQRVQIDLVMIRLGLKNYYPFISSMETKHFNWRMI
jgi:hypothetical protein